MILLKNHNIINYALKTFCIKYLNVLYGKLLRNYYDAIILHRPV